MTEEKLEMCKYCTSLTCTVGFECDEYKKAKGMIIKDNNEIKKPSLEKFMKEHYDEDVVNYDKSQLCISTKQEVFTDLEKYRVKTGCILINQNAFMVLKEKHLGKNE